MDTEDLTIRSAEPEDYQALHALHTQPRVLWGTTQIPFTSVEVWRRRCIDRPENRRVLVACIGREIVGDAELSVPVAVRRRHTGELGLAVHDAWQRRGIGKALFGAVIDLADRWFNLSRLELTVYADNIPAISLYEKFGFRQEGRFVRYVYRDGEYVDALAMARMRDG